MADTASIQAIQKSLIRKPLAGAVLLAPVETTIPASLTAGATSVFTVPTGFKSLGAISKDNAPTFTPETETSDVNTWGLLEASRTDIISRNTTVAWTGQESHRANLELYHGVDLSAIEADAVTGEVEFTDPTSPDLIYHRAMFVAVDGSGANAIYIVKICPNFIVTEVGEQQWSEENALEFQITGRAKVDEELGYAIKTVFCGPGWKKLGDKTGFASA